MDDQPVEPANDDREILDRIEADKIGRKKVLAVAVLVFINLLNYVDRYTIVGVMSRLKDYFDMNDKDSGMLQTVFICTYMIFAPLYGYLGDRYNRKVLMMVGILVWITAVLLSTFCTEEHYWLFLLCRSVVGIGEASYSTIAPTIISDLFSVESRSKVLMVFFFAVPFGSGLGFISGSQIALWTDSWQWGVRLSPILGIVSILMMLVFLEEPVRGANDGGAVEERDQQSFWQDIAYLMKIKSYIYVSLAIIAGMFTIGTLSWWTPPFIGYAYSVINHTHSSEDELAMVNLIFGVITCVSGILGVSVGTMLARAWRDGRFLFDATNKADAYVCAVGMFASLPLLFTGILVSEKSVNVAFVFFFFGITLMCFNWAINADIVMYVVVANKRATALAFQMLTSHLFGDAFSPYIIGAISDELRGNDESPWGHYYSLRNAFYLPLFMIIVSGAFYLATTFSLENDKKEAEFQMNVESNEQSEDLQVLVSDME